MSLERLLEQHSENDEKSFEKIEAQIKDLTEEIRGLRTEIARYKGFVGGIVFVISCLFAALGVAIAWLK